jgi:hypothetical protein
MGSLYLFLVGGTVATVWDSPAIIFNSFDRGHATTPDHTTDTAQHGGVLKIVINKNGTQPKFRLGGSVLEWLLLASWPMGILLLLSFIYFGMS